MIKNILGSLLIIGLCFPNFLYASDNLIVKKNKIFSSEKVKAFEEYDPFTENNKKYIVGYTESSTEIRELDSSLNSSASDFIKNYLPRKGYGELEYLMLKQGNDGIVFIKNQKDTTFLMRSTFGRGDNRYTRARHGSFQFKFNNSDDVFTIVGRSCCLNTTTAEVDIEMNKELIENIMTKEFMYVKSIIINKSQVLKINLSELQNAFKAVDFFVQKK